jgi:proline racemase
MEIIKTIDVHTAGEPLRIVTSGFPELTGNTILEKRACARKHFDHLRKLIMLEPRGHADMYGCILVQPEHDDADIGVLFIHNEGYSTMCGHGIIGLVKAGLELNLFQTRDSRSTIRIDTPAGRVNAQAKWENDRIESVSFLNVPSFVLKTDVNVSTQRFGQITATIAFGGAFYAYVDAAQFDFSLDSNGYSEIVAAGKHIKQSIMEQIPIGHQAFDQDLNFLYGVIFVGEATNPNNHSRNVCVFADGEVDRSPTGTGVSGRAAILFQQGKIKLDQSISIESILGTTFKVRVDSQCEVAGTPAIVPAVSGRAFVTGRHEFVLDQFDEIADGFLLR